MMSKVQERLRQFLSSQGLKALQFEQVCGLSNGTAAKICETSRKSTLQKIHNAYPNLSLEWLMTGEGDMMVESDSGTSEPVIDQSVKVSQSVNIPRPAAGSCQELVNTLQREVAYLKQQLDQSNQRCDRLIEILDKK